MSAFLGEGPSTSKSRLISSSGYGMYWLASICTWLSISASARFAGRLIVFVNTADPETATAQYLELEPEFRTADWIQSGDVEGDGGEHRMAEHVGPVHGVCATIVVRELRELDVDISFAPVLDLGGPTSSIIGNRGFHTDPLITKLSS